MKWHCKEIFWVIMDFWEFHQAVSLKPPLFVSPCHPLSLPFFTTVSYMGNDKHPPGRIGGKFPGLKGFT